MLKCFSETRKSIIILTDKTMKFDDLYNTAVITNEIIQQFLGETDLLSKFDFDNE